MEQVSYVIIWWAGALVWLAALAAITVVLAGIASWAANCMGRNLMSFVRFSTARYWVQRMEADGLTIPQSEYRKMVAARKPRTVSDFVNLDREDESLRQEEKKK